jgi:hypothetical protein
MSALPQLVAQLVDQVHAWTVHQREQNYEAGRALTAEEIGQLGGFFPGPMLQRVRLRVVRQINNPPFYERPITALAQHGVNAQFDLRGAGGITFVDCILVCHGEESLSLLFHEMVHFAQYELLGSERFARGYIQGLAAVGFVYEANAFERVAYELQHRFDAGEHFDGFEEVTGWCR